MTDFLLDTGPLSVLCGFPLVGRSYIHTILSYTDIALAEGVISEIQAAPSGKIARVMSPLLRTRIQRVLINDEPAILDQAYSKLLGLGERSTIRVAMRSPEWTAVIDDKDAFIVACRFGVHPIGFQDFIVKLVKEREMPKSKAIEIVKTTTRQFPSSYLVHTLDMLG